MAYGESAGVPERAGSLVDADLLTGFRLANGERFAGGGDVGFAFFAEAEDAAVVGRGGGGEVAGRAGAVESRFAANFAGGGGEAG